MSCASVAALHCLAMGCAVCFLTACATRGGVQVVHDMTPIDRSSVTGVTVDTFSAGAFAARDGTTLRYRLLGPATLAVGARYPLVVQLHGSGGIGDDNQKQMEIAAKAWALPDIRRRYPAFVLVPQLGVRSADYDDPEHPRSAQASTALRAALELIDQVATAQPVDRQRIYATGFSMGGSATWLAVMLRPHYFAAAMPVSGIAPPLSEAPLLRDTPLLVMHGDADTENPIDSDRDMVAAIRAAGGGDIRLREYVGLAHATPADVVPGDWWRDWLFSHRRRLESR